MCLQCDIDTHENLLIKPETPVTVASSSSQSSSIAKPIQTTAPSPVPQQQSVQPPISPMIPPLKQKTGIVKSKVPPPVPPRGSPRVDRRTSASSQKSTGASPRATPSSGRHEINYLNDKYFDTIQPNPNNMCRLSPQKLYKKDENVSGSPSRTPIFRNRSPTCVRDWLEVNDFAASDYDESVLQFKITEPTKCITIKPRRPLPIRTAHLQRQSSFRAFSYSSDSSVRYKIEKYANETVANQTTTNANTNNSNNNNHDEMAGISANIVSDLIKSYDNNRNGSNNPINNNNFDDNNNNGGTASDAIPHPESMDIETTIEKGNLFKLRQTFENVSPNSVAPNAITPPVVKPRTKKKKIANATLPLPTQKNVTFNDQPETILRTLQRKKAPQIVNNKTDENDNTMKHAILKSHSSIMPAENSNYLDTFSLDGEFV